MIRPEHFEEAERIIAAVTHHGQLEAGDHADVLALAQVHATLALVYAANRAQTEMYGLLRTMIDTAEERFAALENGDPS